MKKARLLLWSLTVFGVLGVFSSSPVLAQSVPAITNISDNRALYSGQSIPRYKKIEITFSINSASVTNPYVPYDADPPVGINPSSVKGITVTGFFKNPNNQVFEQPGFYYEMFDHQLKNDNDWLYPAGQNNWKLRFSPDSTGQWQYWIKVQDATGVSQSNPVNFSVSASDKHGFLQVSSDPRYFEFEDGTYFPGLGYNSNFTWIDWFNPTKSNIPRMESMQENGIQLTRIWASHWNIYGTTWSPWRSHNPVFRAQEPNTGLAHPGDSRLAAYSSKLSPPAAVNGRGFYLWLNYDETATSDGKQSQFDPCRVWGDTVPVITVKRNTNYLLKMRFRTADLTGPKVAGKPYGLVVKRQEGGELWHATNETSRCYYPGTGTVLGATYPAPNGEWSVKLDPSNSGWSILEGTFHNGSQDFIKYLYLALENVQNDGADKSAGHAFIDEVRIEEIVNGQPTGRNIMPRSHMDFQQYINQRNAAAFDYVLEQAEDHDVYFKAVMLDKNDYIFQSMNFDGSLASNKSVDKFYGNLRESTPQTETQARWWQKAWWRYMQARWGYSPNIHSWELLNEGNDGPRNGPHWVMADEFGKYMKCGVFNQPTGVAGNNHTCGYKHPNSHMTTTSFFSGSYPYFFWKNDGGNYSNLDYADRHYYTKAGDAGFYDEAQSTLDIGQQYGAYSTNWSDKPFMRGETAWKFGDATDLFAQNASNGLWLHNFLWAGLNPTGVFEQYWLDARTVNHIFRESGSLLFDHRPKYGNVYNFVKDIPLNNTHYEDAVPQVSNSSLRVVGQKDLTNKRAHLWIQNKNNTWKNVHDQVNISPQSGNITIGGFQPSISYPVQWWNTNTGTPGTTQTISTNANGQLILSVTNLASDTAVRIGTYPQSQTPTPTTPGVIAQCTTKQALKNGEQITQIQVGEEFTYELTLSPSNHTGASVSDPIPEGLSVIASSLPQYCNATGNVLGVSVVRTNLSNITILLILVFTVSVGGTIYMVVRYKRMKESDNVKTGKRGLSKREFKQIVVIAGTITVLLTVIVVGQVVRERRAAPEDSSAATGTTVICNEVPGGETRVRFNVKAVSGNGSITNKATVVSGGETSTCEHTMTIEGVSETQVPGTTTPPSSTPTGTTVPGGTNTPIPSQTPVAPTNTTAPTTPGATSLPQPTPTIQPTNLPQPTPGVGIACGKADVNNDGKFTLVDFRDFAKIYQSECNDGHLDYGECGHKDSDRNGKIEIRDFQSFAGRYAPRESCAL